MKCQVRCTFSEKVGGASARRPTFFIIQLSSLEHRRLPDRIELRLLHQSHLNELLAMSAGKEAAIRFESLDSEDNVSQATR